MSLTDNADCLLGALFAGRTWGQLRLISRRGKLANVLIRSYVAVPLYLARVATYPSILLVKPPFADMAIPARFRPLNGI
jgi:hypothetical protein